jgi:hypothetical protein
VSFAAIILCVAFQRMLIIIVVYFIIESVRNILVTPSYSSVVQRWATGCMIGVRVPAGTGNFFVHHRVQNGSGAHPSSYAMDSGGSFPEGIAAGA